MPWHAPRACNVGAVCLDARAEVWMDSPIRPRHRSREDAGVSVSLPRYSAYSRASGDQRHSRSRCYAWSRKSDLTRDIDRVSVTAQVCLCLAGIAIFFTKRPRHPRPAKELQPNTSVCSVDEQTTMMGSSKHHLRPPDPRGLEATTRTVKAGEAGSRQEQPPQLERAVGPRVCQIQFRHGIFPEPPSPHHQVPRVLHRLSYAPTPWHRSS